MLAAILVALLPKCPACWSAYAGLSSLLGLSFVVEARYLLPLTAGLLSLAVGALARKAQRSRRYEPCVLGLVASGGVLIGKFGIESALLMYTSVGALAMATLWSGGLGSMLRRSSLPTRTAP
jgi:mercuric ion transport protein